VRTARSARRTTAGAGAAVALALTALALAPTAQATPTGAFATQAGAGGTGSRGGTATATVLRTALDVAVLHRTADVPLDVTLDDVRAPANAAETALSATLAGVNGGRPFDVLRADVATAKATADRHGSQGYVNLVNAQVVLPGLGLTPLVRVRAVTSRATCATGKHPTASSNVLGTITVLGRPVTLSAGGATDVTVAGIGRVHLDLSRTATTSRTAAATALDLTVSVNPLGLDITSIKGDVTLARATCDARQGGGGSTTGGSSNGGSSNGGSSNGGSSNAGSTTGGSSSGTSGGGASGGSANGGSTSGGSASGGSASGGSGSSGSGGSSGTSGGTQTLNPTGQDHGLADTGASSATPYAVGGAGVLLAAGGTALYLARRRRGFGAFGKD
jgi:LPXTG-motif cell wall-anchored protein